MNSRLKLKKSGYCSLCPLLQLLKLQLQGNSTDSKLNNYIGAFKDCILPISSRFQLTKYFSCSVRPPLQLQRSITDTKLNNYPRAFKDSIFPTSSRLQLTKYFSCSLRPAESAAAQPAAAAVPTSCSCRIVQIEKQFVSIRTGLKFGLDYIHRPKAPKLLQARRALGSSGRRPQRLQLVNSNVLKYPKYWMFGSGL